MVFCVLPKEIGGDYKDTAGITRTFLFTMVYGGIMEKSLCGVINHL
jgi:hypothetical protein